MSSFNSATLEVDLAAIVRNYKLLAETFTGPECAAVVKADAYGLGANEVAPALASAGCKKFFVATLDEAIALHEQLRTNNEQRIYVFHGVGKSEEKEFIARNLIPVLNDLEQMERWAKGGEGKPSALHVDSGMCRLGLSESDVRNIAEGDSLKHCNVQLLMSHLACAGTPDDPKNAEQLATFNRLRAELPPLPASFANSSGVFLDKSFHFDLGRPGCALYGITPRSEGKNPMENVVRLTAPIIQLRTLEKDQAVGYGALYTAKRGDRLATVAMGYADGYFRSLTGKGKVFIEDMEAPIVGRVSMDMVIVDVTHIPAVTHDSRVEFIGPHQDVNREAELAGTIGYEVFTRIGNRVRRVYQDIGQKR